MVYCGKPSKGCATCRSRKIRCDQQKPACGQCIKLERACPGYRDMLSLSFRNESDAVIEKAKAKAKATKSGRNPSRRLKTETFHPPKSTSKPPASQPVTASSASTSALSNPPIRQSTSDLPNFALADPYGDFLVRSPDQQTVSPSSLFQPSIEECGTNYFFKHFVAKSGAGPAQGPFFFLHEIAATDGLDDMLKTSIRATGIGALANVSKSSRLLAHARREYTASLRIINAALTSPTEAIKDSTLIAILVLSVFEVTMGAPGLSVRAWTEHINGAAALVKLRGRTQFQTPTGLGIFLMATSSLAISSVQRAIPIPQPIIDLRNEAFEYMTHLRPDASSVFFMKVIDESTLLRARISDGTLRDNTEIINSCLRIEGIFAYLCSNPPPGWEYETVYDSTKAEILYDGYYDIYHDSFLTRNWNAVRSARIFLNQAIRSCVVDGLATEPGSFSSPEFMGLLQMCNDNIIKLRDDILHSVPQQLGFVHRKPFQSPTDDTGVSFTDMLLGASQDQAPPPLVRDPGAPSMGGWFLLWPLFVAGNSHLSPPEIQTYVKKILLFIADEMGLNQARNSVAFIEAVNGQRPFPGADTADLKVNPLFLRQEWMARKGISDFGSGLAGREVLNSILRAGTISDHV